MLLATNGSYPPKFIHNDISAAVTEAKRLQNYLGGEVKILSIVGVVKKEHVPVTELKQTVTVDKNLFSDTDDLPF